MYNQLYDVKELEDFNHGGNRYYILPDSGIAVPSVTSVIYKDVDFPDTPASRIARQRGTAVHDICESYIRNEGRKFASDNVMPATLASFKKIRAEIDDHLGKVFLIEAPLYSKCIWTAGRVDCVGEWKGQPAIIDFKTAKNPKREEWIQSYFIQAACYAFMFHSTFPYPEIKNLVIIIAPDHHERAQVFEMPYHKYRKEMLDIFTKLRDIFYEDNST